MYHISVGISALWDPPYLLFLLKFGSTTELICPPEDLRFLPWTKSKELPSGEVTSLFDAKVLRQLVRVYLTCNPAKAAKDFNYQAELKAVSHWRWFNDGAKGRVSVRSRTWKMEKRAVRAADKSSTAIFREEAGYKLEHGDKPVDINQ